MDEKLKVLFIEDTPIHQIVVEDILENAGYEVHLATTGEEGLEKTKKLLPDLVITDLLLPGIDGFEVCKKLSENPVTKYIPVIILSANDTEENYIKGFESGIFDFIPKPFEPYQLTGRINAVMKYRELRNELIESRQKAVLFELAGAAAHELNQPLTVLKTTSFLLGDKAKKNSLTPEEVDKFVTRMESSITRMSSIIKKMEELDSYDTKDYALGTKIINLTDEKK